MSVAAPRRVAVVGAGISGLTVSYEILTRAGRLPGPLEITCFEASTRTGGHLRSSRENGFLCEWGPTGFLDNSPPTLALARRLRLDDRLVRARPEAARRYLYRRGKLRALPRGALSFLAGSVLSLPGKLRLLGEPFVPRRRADSDESVFDFAARRIGKEAAGTLVDAMVSGVFAGDVRRLSLRSCFPRMHEMEQAHGGLFRALLARRGEGAGGGPAGPGGTLTSFRDGMQELADALSERRVMAPATLRSLLGLQAGAGLYGRAQ